MAEERKKRQEKFRKRSGSLFDKVKKLALDTDAFVALVVRDRAGRVRSFRSSDSLYWPDSIIDLIVSIAISQYVVYLSNQRQKGEKPFRCPRVHPEACYLRLLERDRRREW
jgi:hypothetical protein